MPQSQTSTAEIEDSTAATQAAAGWHESPLEPEQQHRAAAYGLLAALLRSSPDQERLRQVAGFSEVEQGGDEMTLAMSLLGLAANRCTEQAIDDEYHALFIGLGRGELLPYGSFYLTGFLMEKPLGELRDDLDRLGYEREADVHEPEDHIAALCEVMMMLIQEGSSIEQQADFFTSHIDTWSQKFFNDMATADNAVFYKAVARFGSAFMDIEQRYLTAGA